MNDKASANLAESRRHGHRRSEILISVRKTSLYGLLLVLLVGLFGSFYMGMRYGRNMAHEDETIRWSELLAQRSDAADRDLGESREGFLVIEAEPEKPSSPLPAKPQTESSTKAVAKVPTLDLMVTDTAPRRGRFGVQLGAFKTRAESLAFIAKHKKKLQTLPVFLVAVDLKKRGVWTRVRVGEFRTRMLAQKVKKRFGGVLGKGSIVVYYK